MSIDIQSERYESEPMSYKPASNTVIIAATACPNCKAKRGEPCTTITKQPMKLVHVARGDRYRHKVETAEYLRDRMRTQT